MNQQTIASSIWSVADLLRGNWKTIGYGRNSSSFPRRRESSEPAMKRELQPFVYIMASARNGTLYTGVTSSLVQRIWQHREGVVEGFTAKYHVKALVWYEQHETMESAITREKALKKWNREWKLRLIETSNPDWRDLWPEIVGDERIHDQPVARNDPDLVRHSRARGNPEQDEATTPKALDSRAGMTERRHELAHVCGVPANS